MKMKAHTTNVLWVLSGAKQPDVQPSRRALALAEARIRWGAAALIIGDGLASLARGQRP